MNSLERLNGYELQYLARATRNAAFLEELRKRNCESRWHDVSDKVRANCDCWVCERYGIEGYSDFQLHQDVYPPKSSLDNGVCYCWVCEMGR